MKKIYCLTLFIFSVTANIYSQDFNLFNPSNEIYLFSAYNEGADAFRYNPAVLGLKHRLNLSVNAFISNFVGKVRLNEFDISVNSGILGIAYRLARPYRSFWEWDWSEMQHLNNYSIGFGIGNKSISSGVTYEHMTITSFARQNVFSNETESRNRLTFGLLYRPLAMISTAFTIRLNDAIMSYDGLGIKYTFGAGFRPLKNEMITLLADFSFIPYYGEKFFSHNSIKVGFEVNPYKGVYLNGNYMQLNSLYSSHNFINVGLKFDFPHSSFRYTNSFSRFNSQSNYSEDYPLRSVGSLVSLSYSLEKHQSPVKETKRVLEITLSGSLQDYNTEDVFFGLLGEGKRSVHEVIADIDYAAKDPSIKGILLKIYPLSTGLAEINASIEELTNALERFKSTKKKITAYLPENAGPPEYYIATFCDDIIMPEEGILFYGLNMDVVNIKQFLQKYGIELQTFYAGKYKLTFQGLLDSTNEYGKEVINRMLDVIYEKMINRLVVSRNLTIDDYLTTKISQPITGREAKRLGLIDVNGWLSDAEEISRENSGTGNITSNLNRTMWDKGWGEPDQIAIVGVYGSITTGESEAPSSIPIPFIGKNRSTGSETVVRQLEAAFSNPKVKVVILRVDSGGGSALASAEINAAIIRLKKKYKKLFLVSMGSAAASGGYYVSVSADKIFCDALTITGSIGVFNVIPNLDSLFQSQKIKVENFKRGEYSDILSTAKPLSKDEIEIIQGLIDYYYERFISAISEGRKMSKEEIEQIAQGRVWMGTDAYNKKLVDEIGGLSETIKYARKEAGIDKRFKIVYYAVPGGNTLNEIMTGSVLEYLQLNFLELLGFSGDDDNIDIKY